MFGCVYRFIKVRAASDRIKILRDYLLDKTDLQSTSHFLFKPIVDGYLIGVLYPSRLRCGKSVTQSTQKLKSMTCIPFSVCFFFTSKRARNSGTDCALQIAQMMLLASEFEGNANFTPGFGMQFTLYFRAHQASEPGQLTIFGSMLHMLSDKNF